FHPYYTAKDAFYVGLFAILFAVLVFFAPDFVGNPDNYIPANPVVTPADIVPEWYLLPFYAMLRSIPQKLIGVLVLAGAIATLAFIPWLDTSRVRSNRFRPLMKQFFWLFVLDCIVLGYCGSQGVDAAPPGHRLGGDHPRRLCGERADQEVGGLRRGARHLGPAGVSRAAGR
ncbi:MAG: hypothetical protein ACREOE_21220, partial [Gemmatimonadales bacterium]